MSPSAQRCQITLLLSFSIVASPGDRAVAGETAPEPTRVGEWSVTTGAAPGYIEDRACSACHPALYTSFQEVGMARSFFRPAERPAIEDFERGFFHPPSQRHYRIERAGEGLVFRRYLEDASGQRRHETELPVAWVLGSGHRARTYLHRAPNGELYQLPLAWYSQRQEWGMAPGFDRPDHSGINRQVTRKCMFCHNAYPQVPIASDQGLAQAFPAALPSGIGCQRCHGPGGRHVELALRGETSSGSVAAAIVNPARLTPERRNDVCYQCHLQPAVVLPLQRRFGRGDYSYRPGEPLAEYLPQLDVVEEGLAREDRFEINHHPYRLEQSRCFVASGGALSCLTCHDPHRRVAEEDRAAHYRERCLSCHGDDALEPIHVANAELEGGGWEAADCTACHMPPRRPSDVVAVVMTDHRIQGRGGGAAWLETRPEREPGVILDLRFLHPEQTPPGAEGELHRVSSAVAMGADLGAVEHLAGIVERLRPPHPGAYRQLVEGLLANQRESQALHFLEQASTLAPGDSDLRELRALALARSGEVAAAVLILERLVEAGGARPEAHYNLGLLLVAMDREVAAIEQLRSAVELRPNFAAAWQSLGNVYRRLERTELAEEAYRRALIAEPSFPEAQLAVGELLLERGAAAEALDLLELAARTAGARTAGARTAGARTAAKREQLVALQRRAAAALAGD